MNTPEETTREACPETALPGGNVVRAPVLRWALMAFSATMVVVGVIGIFVPGLPTTVFLLIAAWGFSKSSERLQLWLWRHPKLGPPIRNWYGHRVIPPKAKLLAVGMMTLSVIYVAYVVPSAWAWPVMGLVLAPVAVYVLTRASAPPQALASGVGESGSDG